MGESDRQALASAGGAPLQSPLPGQDLRVHLVSPSKDEYHKYYNIFSNPLLWFLQHLMWNSPWTPNISETVYDAWNKGYVPVNQAIAEAIVQEASREEASPFAIIHDYHLYLVGAFLRQRLPQLFTLHFTHIPWPDPGYWQLLPGVMRESILRGLCSNDILGFQTMRAVRNFLHTCHTVLEEAEVDYQAATVRLAGHTVLVRSYPISIDVAGLRRTLHSPAVRSHIDRLRPKCGERTIIRVDRVEPSKNIVRGFKAFDRFLQRYPQFVGKVRFLAFLVPSRTRIWEYQRYMEEINKLVEFINTKYGDVEWQPIEVFYENNYSQALAAMTLYDVLLVNPIIDGMNLVAKEGPIANTKDGVLILSEGAGAHEQLQEGVISICPTDIEGTIEGIYQALTMPQGERRRMLERLRQVVEEEDIIMWLYHQLEDLQALAQTRAAAASSENLQPRLSLPE
jgi:trehalose 6-phosphate synthase